MESEGNETKIEQLAIGVASGLSIHRAAKNLGIPDTTARRWAREASFKPIVEKHRGDIIDEAVGKLSRVSSKAAKTLCELLGPDHSDDVRLKAARAILDGLIMVRDHITISERLNALEDQLKHGQKY